MDHRLNSHSMITQHTSQKTASTKSPSSSEAALHGFKRKQSTVVPVKALQLRKVSCSAVGSDPDETNNTVTHRLPPNVDLEVFKLLPEEIQKELLSPAYANSLPSSLMASTSQSTPVAGADVPQISDNTSLQSPAPSMPVPLSLPDSQNLRDRKETAKELDPSDRATVVNQQRPSGTTAVPGENIMEEGRLSFPKSFDCEFPVNVNPEVFSELPPAVQRELMSEWKQHKPVLKTSTSTSRKPGRSSMTKDKKTAGKSSQSNNLLNYFKPS